MPKRKHPVFTVFDTDEDTENNKCLNCNSVISGSHASNLMSHLKAKHPRIYTEIDDLRNNRENSETTSSQTIIESYAESGQLSIITFESLVNILIEQICINGRPLRSIEDSGIVKILHPIMNQLGNFNPNFIDKLLIGKISKYIYMKEIKLQLRLKTHQFV